MEISSLSRGPLAPANQDNVARSAEAPGSTVSSSDGALRLLT